MSKIVPFNCEFCKATFTCNKSLLRHLRTANKCLNQRPKKDYICVWCQEVFYSNNFLNEHLTKCIVNKEALVMSYIEKLKMKDDIIKEKEETIKDLQEKLFTIANKPTTTTNIKTINNIKLNCDKPLNLEYDNVFNMMKNHLNTTYLTQGGYGIGKWFLKYVCTNERGNICIECTDRTRKIFKYKDEEDELKRVTGDDLHKLIKKSYAEFTTTPLYLEFEEWEKEQRDRGYDTFTTVLTKLSDFKKDFLTHLSDKTSVSSGTCALSTD